jgi:folate-binding protein YgfZ
MLKPVDHSPRPTRLADMGVVRVQGADAVKFLQGQVSNDVARLSAESSVLAGLHNPQGRAIAVLRLVLAAPEEILAIVPRELAGPVAGRLGKFVLRAKAKIADVSSEWDISGVAVGGMAERSPAALVGGIAERSPAALVGSTAGGTAAASVGAARRDEEGRLWVCVDAPASRWLVASHQTEPRGDEAQAALDVGSPMPSSLTRDEWHALDIAAGIPQVYDATSEAFVAQMLNLDVIDGIAFDKGCYTGQEVIARAHYRGKVKRRMQRFRTQAVAKLNPGDTGTLADGRSFKVVDAIQSNDGHCEFLAVTTFGGGSDEGGEASPATSVVNAAQLPLPYSLPA